MGNIYPKNNNYERNTQKRLIKKGTQYSYHLDINHNGERWPEFLEIHINRYNQTDVDREKKKIAEQIRAKREKELLIDNHGLPNHVMKRVEFIPFFKEFSKKWPKWSNPKWCQKKVKKFTDWTKNLYPNHYCQLAQGFQELPPFRSEQQYRQGLLYLPLYGFKYPANGSE